MDCADRDEAHEVQQKLVIARGDASEVFEFVEEPFDCVTFFAEIPVAGMGSASIVAWRDHGHSAGI